MNLDSARSCLIGTALGDSLGLVFEGLKAGRIAKFKPLPLRQRFAFGKGVLSDDTLQSMFVAIAILRHPDSPELAAREFAKMLRAWFLTCPPGIGLSTAKACLKLCFGSRESGVYSAGNGAAMRAAVIGVLTNSDKRDEFVEAISRLTHTDPLAILGAKIVAYAVTVTPEEFDQARFPDWPFDKPIPSTGPTGYVVHTVNAALKIWRHHPNDIQKAIEAAILMGGDTDSVAAIVGGLIGAKTDLTKAIPDLLNWMGWPLPDEIMSLSPSTKASFGRIWLTHAISLPIIIGYGFRRLLPPY